MKPYPFGFLPLLLGSLTGVPVLFAQGVNIPVAAEPTDDAPLQNNPGETAFKIALTLDSDARAAGNRKVPKEEYYQGLELAASKYSDFVRRFPDDKNVPLALYRMAACFAECGKVDQAVQTYSSIVQRYKGDVPAAAAYQLAQYNYQQKNWSNAERFYKATIANTSKSSLKADSKYRLGRVYQQLNRKDDARKQFEEILQMGDIPSAVRKASVLELGDLYYSSGKYAEAYRTFRSIVDDHSSSLREKGEIMIRAAKVAEKLERFDEAKALYSQIIQSPELSKNSDEAQLGLLQILFRKKDYEGLVKSQELGTHPFQNAQLEAQRKLLVAQAYYNLQDYARAERGAQLAENACPNSEPAMKAGFFRIAALIKLGEIESLPVLADKFLRNYDKAFPASPWPEKVRLATADALLEKNPELAARFYMAINFDRIQQPECKKDILYKCAWAWDKAGNRSAALELIEKFISGYPKDSKVPTALVLRGDLMSKMGREADALDEFNRVIMEWPRTESASTAWLRSAQIYNRKQDQNNMIRCYEGLIKNFPTANPSTLAEARFMIGRGYHDKKEFDKAVVHFQEAKTLNPEAYGESSSYYLARCYYSMQNAEKLKDILEDVSAKNSKALASIDMPILAWMGMQAFNGKDFRIADKYLTVATRVPEYWSGKNVIWKNLAKARLALKRYDRALEAINTYLKGEGEAPSARKADAMLDKTQILLGMGKFAEARQTVEEALSMGIEGPLQAALNIALGDVCFAEKKFDEAAKYYVRTAQLLTNDKDLKPEAISKASQALEKSGRVAEAGQYKAMLEREYPNWTPSEAQTLSSVGS